MLALSPLLFIYPFNLLRSLSCFLSCHYVIRLFFLLIDGIKDALSGPFLFDFATSLYHELFLTLRSNHSCFCRKGQLASIPFLFLDLSLLVCFKFSDSLLDGERFCRLFFFQLVFGLLTKVCVQFIFISSYLSLKFESAIWTIARQFILHLLLVFGLYLF